MQSFSQCGQDLFALKLSNNKRNGSYLEIGAGPPAHISNTFLLEKNYNWVGKSLDINPNFLPAWEVHRKNKLLVQDATTADYNKICQDIVDLTGNPSSRVIDYLSLDIDDKYNEVLIRIPFEKFQFQVITIEHDFYLYGDTHRKGEREFLTSKGYKLLCRNVMTDNQQFEDWWVHPSIYDAFSYLDCEATEGFEIVKRIKDELEVEKLNSVDLILIKTYIERGFANKLILESENFDMAVIKQKIKTLLGAVVED